MSAKRPLIGACWLQVVATYASYWPNEPSGVRVAQVTKRKPRNPRPGCLLIRVTLSVPAGAFIPPEHDIALQVTDEQLDLVPVVTAEPRYDGQ